MATTRKTKSYNHSNFLDNNFCPLLHNTSHCGVYSQNLRVNHCLHRLLNSPTRSLDSVVSLVKITQCWLPCTEEVQSSPVVCWYFSIRQSVHCLNCLKRNHQWESLYWRITYITPAYHIKSTVQHITVTPHHLLHVVSPVASAVAIHQCVWKRVWCVWVSVAQYLQL